MKTQHMLKGAITSLGALALLGIVTDRSAAKLLRETTRSANTLLVSAQGTTMPTHYRTTGNQDWPPRRSVPAPKPDYDEPEVWDDVEPVQRESGWVRAFWFLAMFGCWMWILSGWWTWLAAIVSLVIAALVSCADLIVTAFREAE